MMKHQPRWISPILWLLLVNMPHKRTYLLASIGSSNLSSSVGKPIPGMPNSNGMNQTGQVKDYTDSKDALMQILKQKDRSRQELEKKFNEIKRQHGTVQIKNLNQKFGTGGIDFIEEHLQSAVTTSKPDSTDLDNQADVTTGVQRSGGTFIGGGLISKHELKMKKDQIELVIVEEQANRAQLMRMQDAKKRELKMLQKKQNTGEIIEQKNKLSFIDEEEEEQALNINVNDSSAKLEPRFKRRCFGKNPDVNTQFLEDKERIESELNQKKNLIKDFYQYQQNQKLQQIEITYQYWDGSHQPQKMVVTKGNTMSEVISQCLIKLGTIYKQLDGAPVEGFIIVKGDYILPAQATYLDIEQTKRTQIRDQIFRLQTHRILKSESKFKKKDQLTAEDYEEIERDAGEKCKIIEKVVYDRQKHIFPYRNWKTFDPTSENQTRSVLD
eukprot:403333345